MPVGPLIPPPSKKVGPLIPPPPKRSQTRRRRHKRSSSGKRKPCTGSRKTCRRRELRRRAAEKRRRQVAVAKKVESASTAQSVLEASADTGSYLSTDSGYNEYREYMEQGRLKNEELGEFQQEIEELEAAGNHEQAAEKRKELKMIVDKIAAMNRTYQMHDEPIMPLTTTS